MKSSYVLGNKVKDIVTGFTGIATSRSEFLNGCVQVGISPEIKKDGSKSDTEWFDEQQIRYVGVGVATEIKKVAPVEEVKKPGGPQKNPSRVGMARA